MMWVAAGIWFILAIMQLVFQNGVHWGAAMFIYAVFGLIFVLLELTERRQNKHFQNLYNIIHELNEGNTFLSEKNDELRRNLDQMERNILIKQINQYRGYEAAFHPDMSLAEIRMLKNNLENNIRRGSE